MIMENTKTYVCSIWLLSALLWERLYVFKVEINEDKIKRLVM